MRSFLILNRPWQGTGNSSDWSFSGADERTLRGCLDRLDSFATPDPTDRWVAAIVFGPAADSPIVTRRGRGWGIRPGELERAWTIDGALALAEMLPDGLDDLREDLSKSFSDRKAGWLGDARTPPRPED
jgi:hypothetical protein